MIQAAKIIGTGMAAIGKLIAGITNKITTFLPNILIALLVTIPARILGVMLFFGSNALFFLSWAIGFIHIVLLHITIQGFGSKFNYYSLRKSIFVSSILYSIFFFTFFYLTTSGILCNFNLWVLNSIFIPFVYIPANAFLKCLEPYLSSNAPNKLPLGEKPNTNSNKDSLGEYIGLVLSMDRDPSTNPGQGSNRDPWEGSSRGSAVIRRPSQHIEPQPTIPASREVTMGEAPSYDGKGKGRERIADQQLDVARKRVSQASQSSGRSSRSEELWPNGEAWNKPQFRSDLDTDNYETQPRTHNKKKVDGFSPFSDPSREYPSEDCLKDNSIEFKPFEYTIVMSDGQEMDGTALPYVRPNREILDRGHFQYTNPDAYEREWSDPNPSVNTGPRDVLFHINWGEEMYKRLGGDGYTSHKALMNAISNLSLFDRIILWNIVKEKYSITPDQLSRTQLATLKSMLNNIKGVGMIKYHLYALEEIREKLSYENYNTIPLISLGRQTVFSMLRVLNQIQQAKLSLRDDILNSYINLNNIIKHGVQFTHGFKVPVEETLYNILVLEQRYSKYDRIEEQILSRIDNIEGELDIEIPVIRRHWGD